MTEPDGGPTVQAEPEATPAPQVEEVVSHPKPSESTKEARRHTWRMMAIQKGQKQAKANMERDVRIIKGEEIETDPAAKAILASKSDVRLAAGLESEEERIRYAPLFSDAAIAQAYPGKTFGELPKEIQESITAVHGSRRRPGASPYSGTESVVAPTPGSKIKMDDGTEYDDADVRLDMMGILASHGIISPEKHQAYIDTDAKVRKDPKNASYYRNEYRRAHDPEGLSRYMVEVDPATGDVMPYVRKTTEPVDLSDDVKLSIAKATGQVGSTPEQTIENVKGVAPTGRATFPSRVKTDDGSTYQVKNRSSMLSAISDTSAKFTRGTNQLPEDPEAVGEAKTFKEYPDNTDASTITEMSDPGDILTPGDIRQILRSDVDPVRASIEREFRTQVAGVGHVTGTIGSIYGRQVAKDDAGERLTLSSNLDTAAIDPETRRLLDFGEVDTEDGEGPSAMTSAGLTDRQRRASEAAALERDTVRIDAMSAGADKYFAENYDSVASLVDAETPGLDQEARTQAIVSRLMVGLYGTGDRMDNPFAAPVPGQSTARVDPYYIDAAGERTEIPTQAGEMAGIYAHGDYGGGVGILANSASRMDLRDVITEDAARAAKEYDGMLTTLEMRQRDLKNLQEGTPEFDAAVRDIAGLSAIVSDLRGKVDSTGQAYSRLFGKKYELPERVSLYSGDAPEPVATPVEEVAAGPPNPQVEAAVEEALQIARSEVKAPVAGGSKLRRAILPEAIIDSSIAPSPDGRYVIPGVRKAFDEWASPDTPDDIRPLLENLLHETGERVYAMAEKIPAMPGKNLVREVSRTQGRFGNAEPSNQTRIKNFEKIEDVLGMAKQFQESAYQKAVMVRTNSVEAGTKIGHLYDDGSYNTESYSLPLAKVDKETLGQLDEMAKGAGLHGFNVNSETGSIEFYYANGAEDADAITRWKESAKRFIADVVGAGLYGNQSVHRGADGITSKPHRLYVVDDGFGRDRGGDRFGSAGKGPIPGARALATLARAKLNPTLSPEIDWDRLSKKPIDKAFHERAALAHDAMSDNNLVDPVVRGAYEALRRDVDLQASYSPYEYQFSDVQYGNSDLMRADVTNTGRMNVYKTEAGSFGPEGVDFTGHPLLDETGQTLPFVKGDKAGVVPELYNDRFRFIHDLIAHGTNPNSFGPIGEEAAFKTHAVTMTPEAIPALAAETRLQNSWVNNSRRPSMFDASVSVGEWNQANKDQTEFARQKADIPDDPEFVMTGDPEMDLLLMNLYRRRKQASNYT